MFYNMFYNIITLFFGYCTYQLFFVYPNKQYDEKIEEDKEKIQEIEARTQKRKPEYDEKIKNLDGENVYKYFGESVTSELAIPYFTIHDANIDIFHKSNHTCYPFFAQQILAESSFDSETEVHQ